MFQVYEKSKLQMLTATACSDGRRNSNSEYFLVFQQFGVSDEELASHFAGPAFLAWGRMGNINSWGGPLSDGKIFSYSTASLLTKV